MRRTISLVWKEWHETGPLFWIAMGVFVGLPIIGGVEGMFYPPHRFVFDGSAWVTALGGVLAVFVGAGAACRDFGDHLEDFWRSRPVGAARWMLVKYLVGLAVVIVACGLPIVLEPWLNSRRVVDEMLLRPEAILVPQLCVSAAIYSLAFLAGCLVRRTAQAAMLGLTAMLLVYFLPMVVGRLSWLALDEVFADKVPAGRLGGFAGGMLSIAAAASLAALAAVAWGWRIESRREMLYGSVSAVLLILMATAGLSAGTNLPILQEVSLPAGEIVFDTLLLDAPADGGRVNEQRVLIAAQVPPANEDGKNLFSLPDARNWTWHRYVATVGETGMRLEPAEGKDVDRGIPFSAKEIFERGGFEYRLGWESELVHAHQPYNSVSRWFLESRRAGADEFKEWPIGFKADKGEEAQYQGANLYLWKDRLYLIGPRLVVCDVSEAGRPRVILDRSWAYRPQRVEFGEQELTIALPPLPGVGAEQRLAAAMVGQEAFDGEVLCGTAQNSRDRLCAYRLASLSEDRATFRMIGQYERSILQRTLLPRLFGGLRLENGLLYLETGFGETRYFYVFDTRGSRPMRLVGHIAVAWKPAATPRAWENTSICPLPDGRAVVGEGNQIWLTGAPSE
jgi:hypothetical protein